jgi:hypothetical protein
LAIFALCDQHREAQVRIGLKRYRKSVVGGGVCHSGSPCTTINPSCGAISQTQSFGAAKKKPAAAGAGRAAGISANTLLRWLKVPEFQNAYREARRTAFGQAVARLQQGTAAAATTLRSQAGFKSLAEFDRLHPATMSTTSFRRLGRAHWR